MSEWEWDEPPNWEGTAIRIHPKDSGDVIAMISIPAWGRKKAVSLAHRITAAPDLEEVARFALCDIVQPGSVDREALEAKARAALKKARGEA